MNQVKISKTNRRNFFSRAAKGVLGFAIFSAIPIKIFSSKLEIKKFKKVKIHLSAIKRTN